MPHVSMHRGEPATVESRGIFDDIGGFFEDVGGGISDFFTDPSNLGIFSPTPDRPRPPPAPPTVQIEGVPDFGQFFRDLFPADPLARAPLATVGVPVRPGRVSPVPPGIVAPTGTGGLPDETVTGGVSLISRIIACLVSGQSITDCLFPPRPGPASPGNIIFNFPDFPNITLPGQTRPGLPTVGGPTVPHVPIFPSLGHGEGVLDDIINIGTGLIDRFRGGPIALPGGAQLPGFNAADNLPALPGLGGGPMANGATGGFGVTCITPRQSMTRRLPSRVDVPLVDASGNTRYVTYKNMGRPILFTGDFAACKRVKKAGARARSATRGGR